MSVRVPQPIVVLHGGGVSLACGLDGQMHVDEMHGLFAGDTRMLSTYRIAVSGAPWQRLGRSRVGHGTAQWEFQNSAIRDPAGDIPAGRLLLSLKRRVDGILHDDLLVRAFGDRPLRVRLTLHLDADFADIFQVRRGSIPPRLNISRAPDLCGAVLSYERGNFRRRLHIRCEAPSPPVYTGTMIVYEIDLQPGMEWRACLEAAPEIDGELLQTSGDPHGPEPNPAGEFSAVRLRAPALLEGPFQRGREDLHSLAMVRPGRWPYVAAGVPWFLTLFGRDSLMTALMAGLDGAWMARGALEALGELQATRRDDWRDAEPGKFPHEIRRGELSHTGVIPHAAYYGAHDVPSLYCLALWQAWRWTGDTGLVDSHLPAALAGLRWCDTLGDRDGDGFQEYATRSPQGYFNQSWKDAGDAILHADGRLPELPLAPVELQGYWFAARLAMADLLDARGEAADAQALRSAARKLQARVEERFWMEDAAFYALALDGNKAPVRSLASNAGHLLWAGLSARPRAEAVAARFLQPDFFSGWGLRTLSSEHPAYNPLSYHLGSVWPHDTMLAAAGLWRYGLHDAAATLIHVLLEAATAFEEERLPELFCGLDRSHGLPVPYAEANSPQAWAAAVPVLAAQLFLGLVPDAPNQRCYVAPWLPSWLPKLELHGIAVGAGTLDVTVIRRGEETVVDQLNGKDVDVVQQTVGAPLWGDPVSFQED